MDYHVRGIKPLKDRGLTVGHPLVARSSFACMAMLGISFLNTAAFGQTTTKTKATNTSQLTPETCSKEAQKAAKPCITDEAPEGASHALLSSVAADENLEVVGSAHSYTTPAATLWGKTPVALKDIPQSVSVVTQQRMEDQNMQSMTDVLKQVTGVTIQPNDTTNSQYYARGYSLNVTTDGGFEKPFGSELFCVIPFLRR